MSYQLTRWAERGEIDGNQYAVKTIVTSQMANAVAEHFGVKCYDCLTGFKYIAKIIRENEGEAKYIGGGEESFGYLAGDYVRDKDAVSACALAAEAAAWAKDTMGLTLYEWLQQLYVKYGFFRESLVSVRPSGTEPKIKFYFGVKEPLPSVEQYDEVLAKLDAKIETIKQDLKLV